MSTYFPSGKELAGRRKWYVVDASGQTLGHLASEVALILTGKRSPEWTPFMDTGDHVVVINARKAVLKGNKIEQKLYRHHTPYPGGLRETTAKEMIAKKPERVIELVENGLMERAGLPAGGWQDMGPGPRWESIFVGAGPIYVLVPKYSAITYCMVELKGEACAACGFVALESSM